MAGWVRGWATRQVGHQLNGPLCVLGVRGSDFHAQVPLGTSIARVAGVRHWPAQNRVVFLQFFPSCPIHVVCHPPPPPAPDITMCDWLPVPFPCIYRLEPTVMQPRETQVAAVEAGTVHPTASSAVHSAPPTVCPQARPPCHLASLAPAVEADRAAPRLAGCWATWTGCWMPCFEGCWGLFFQAGGDEQRGIATAFCAWACEKNELSIYIVAGLPHAAPAGLPTLSTRFFTLV